MDVYKNSLHSRKYRKYNHLGVRINAFFNKSMFVGQCPFLLFSIIFVSNLLFLKGYNGELTSMSTTSSLDSGYGCLRSKPRWL